MESKEYFGTPILLLIFNRPDVTRQVFNSIKSLKPGVIYISADGPRADKPSDINLCKQTREIFDNIDWPCRIYKKFSDENLGCGKSVSEAITWFFTNEEYGIILEDDCLPLTSFFTFCQANLKKYEHNSQVMHISGSCHAPETLTGNYSYYYSKFEHVWGWATWRRAWQLYDFNLDNYDKKSRLLIQNSNKRIMLDRLKKEKLKFTWDYQWYFCIVFNNGVCITPKKSLIKNIGFGKNATNTIFKPKWMNSTLIGEIESIIHPPKIEINSEADRYLHTRIYKNSIAKNFAKIIYKLILYIYKL